MNCYLLQHDIMWENPGQNMSGILRFLNELEIQKNSLLVLPEMFVTGFSMNAAGIAQTMDGEVVNWMKDVASRFQVLLAGSVAVKDSGNFYNRFLWVFPDGSLQYYDKKHLFSPGGENDIYTAGNERKIINYQGFRILPQICYDLRFPVWSRNKNDYDVLVYAANWPTARENAWNSLLVARAIENQAYVLGVNRIGSGNNIPCCGNSQIIDFKGDIIEKADKDNTETLFAQLNLHELKLYREKLAFWKDADNFELK